MSCLMCDNGVVTMQWINCNGTKSKPILIPCEYCEQRDRKERMLESQRVLDKSP